MAALPVCERHRSFGNTDRIRRLPAAVTESTRSQFIHLFDRFDACLAESGIGGLKTAVAEQVATIVGRLNHSHAETMEVSEPRQIRFEHDAVLKTIDDAGARTAFGLRNVGDRSDAHERIRVVFDLALIPEDVANDLHVCRGWRRRPDDANRGVRARQTGVANILHLSGGKRRVRISTQAARPAQSVDDDSRVIAFPRNGSSRNAPSARERSCASHTISQYGAS